MRMGVLGAVLLVACGGSSRRSGPDRPASGGTGGDGAGGTGTGGELGASGGSGGRGSGAVGGSGRGAGGGSGGDGASGVGGSGGDGASGAGGEPDDIGGTGGVAGTVTAGSAGKPNVPITTCNQQFPFLGTWEGNVLDFYFEPMEALTLVLEEKGGTVTGTLTWGEGEPPPPVEGADIPYPPGYWGVSGHGGAGGGAAPWQGFPYTVVRGAGCDSALRFGISTSELWQEWCALQTPVFTPEYGWGCTLQGGGSSDGMSCTVQAQGIEWETYPLWKCDACGAFNVGRGLCACDESGCFANLEPTRIFELTLGDADGSAVLSGPDSTCGDCTVRLVRRD